MHKQIPRHRLFIAVPVFAFCLVWSVVGGMVHAGPSPVADLPGTTLRVTEGERIVQIPGGIVRLGKESILHITDDGAELERGSALAVADGRLVLHVSDADISGWAGGFHVTAHGDRISIAALTTPVRIDRDGGTMIVPVRTQVPTLSNAAIVAVPQHFLRENQPAIVMLQDRLPQSSFSLESAPPSAVVSALRFPAARDRANREAGRGTDCGLHLVSAASQGTAGSLLLPCIERAEDWMLLSFHLAVRNAVWSLPAPSSATVEDRIRRIELLPLSDRGSVAVPEQIVSWWAQDAAAILADASGALLADRLPMITTAIAHLSQAGYPDRAKRYATRLLALEKHAPVQFGSVVTSLRSILADAVPRFTIPLHASLSTRPVDRPIPAEVTPDPTLLADADRALRDAGFMFTGGTYIELEGSSVAVRDIVLGTPKGHQVVQFSFNPATNTVSRIGVDGKLLPYSLPLDRYVRWVRGEKLE